MACHLLSNLCAFRCVKNLSGYAPKIERFWLSEFMSCNSKFEEYWYVYRFTIFRLIWCNYSFYFIFCPCRVPLFAAWVSSFKRNPNIFPKLMNIKKKICYGVGTVTLYAYRILWDLLCQWILSSYVLIALTLKNSVIYACVQFDSSSTFTFEILMDDHHES